MNKYSARNPNNNDVKILLKKVESLRKALKELRGICKNLKSSNIHLQEKSDSIATWSELEANNIEEYLAEIKTNQWSLEEAQENIYEFITIPYYIHSLAEIIASNPALAFVKPSLPVDDLASAMGSVIHEALCESVYEAVSEYFERNDSDQEV